MNFKNAILFFGVLTYVFHCQGYKPSQKELETIRNAFRQLKNDQNVVDVYGLINIIDAVGNKLDAPKMLPSRDDMIRTLAGNTFTLDDVETIAIDYLPSQDPKNVEIISEVIKQHEKPNGIDFEELRLIVNEITQQIGVHKHFPKLDEYKAFAEKHRFTTDAIEEIALNYLGRDHPQIESIISKIVKDHQKPNGLNYEELIDVMEKIIKDTDAKKVFPRVDQIEMAYTKKVPMNEVEGMVYEYLF